MKKVGVGDLLLDAKVAAASNGVRIVIPSGVRGDDAIFIVGYVLTYGGMYVGVP